MVTLLRSRSPLIIALLATGAAAADATFVSGTAEPSSAPTDAGDITSQSPEATALLSMSTARRQHTATLLAGGQVLIAGGSPTFVTAELYEPTQQAFKPIADMRYGRQAHTATRLPSGSVLIAGGRDQSGVGLSEAELFIPTSATFTLIYPMTTARSSHTATLLGNNHVLIAGGDYSTGNTAELFDPITRTFTRTGTMNHPRDGHAAVLLTDGRVLITGGFPSGNTAEIFDPRTGQFSPTGSMLQPRHDHTATLIGGGNVLITGGEWNSGLGSEALSSAEIYEPPSGRFFAVQPMSVGRVGHTATALADGTVLVAGGATRFAENPVGCGPLYFYWETGSAERFNPATRQFTFVSVDLMPVPRSGHTATRLPTGGVLVTGGTTLVNKLCGIIARYHRIIGEIPTPTATAEILATSGTNATLSPTTLKFTSQGVGMASSSSVTLSNYGVETLNIGSIAATADFTETNTCGASLASGGNCSIYVTFTPTATGTVTGRLSVTDNAPGSPQTVSLSGTCVGCIPQGHICYGPGPTKCCRAPYPHHSYCSDATGWGTCVSN